MRPLFPKNFYNEVQVIITVLASDSTNPHPILDIIGTSAALSISDIPFEYPIGASVIGLIDGELVVNPTYEELEKSDLELTVAGNGDSTMMVEAGAKFVKEDVMLEALNLAQEVNGQISDLISEMKNEIGKLLILLEKVLKLFFMMKVLNKQEMNRFQKLKEMF